ncbi:hypothetical protein [Microbacterium foliorum]|uniref:hypothetical protein n=1 Tax=Microbacterium foliorum TaxID=104336 RepID=UPI001DCEAC31|nr:hypothetical protein [Microbacterium foliorum]CAH0195486.1 hypothetical protein SRABI03_01846 [Microbacterium foliorum]CAH0233117.1 hypothetical protein SRABI44_02718 [Microbacterium foliorum]
MTRRTRQRTWILGGVGLIACGILGVLPPGGRVGSGPILLVTDVLFAASVLLFAVGLSRDASVVTRRPLGVTAMAIVAIWPLLSSVITRAMGPGVSPNDDAWVAYGYIALFIPTAAGLVAAMQIARSDTVPSPWRWAPAWVLGMQALAWAVSQAVLVTARPENVQSFAEPFHMLGTLASLAATLGLGILALILAARSRPESVQVYRSP